jgi:hypothetical protein
MFISFFPALLFVIELYGDRPASCPDEPTDHEFVTGQEPRRSAIFITPNHNATFEPKITAVQIAGGKGLSSAALRAGAI